MLLLFVFDIANAKIVAAIALVEILTNISVVWFIAVIIDFKIELIELID